MQISWINKFSLIDYPQKTSCIIFTPWCNLRCSFCHNPEFVLPELLENTLKDLILEKAFFNFLEKRKWLLDWVSICWWEPTLQKDLEDFCRKIKDMWYLVKLDTNGRDPDLLKRLIDDRLVDYVAMDIKHTLFKYSQITWVVENTETYLKSINLLISSNIDYEFRTTVVKWEHFVSDIENIAKILDWAKKYFIQNYRKWNIIKPDFVWESFIESELVEFKKIWEKYIEKVWIRE